MSNERVTYAELNVAKNSRNQHRKPRDTRSSISLIEQEIIYADFSFQNPSQEHPWIGRDCCCKDTEAKAWINSSMTRTHRAQPCGPCPKEWISYSHNCYYIGVERKSWNDSSMSCISKTCSLLHIDSEEEQAFLQSLSFVSWTGLFRKSRSQPWVWKNNSTFKPKIAEISHDEHNCAMMSASGLIADNCTALHTYLCKCKFTN
ncbi:NKG2-A/NKG2-B type II integral membrane protein-like isoform X8 [Apodemus sylvaticus]|uniref:NKG2-A/NKG2-B type II integral membrane protein-like isoform X8 n=1 Tax=Apodemus sylvaticus TaxID=10129 RepID=UPI002243C064|nr:NKG2-A/NKG2-B type II integral membrane protein-like isoform X8 [Apodemus sylvaticus]